MSTTLLSRRHAATERTVIVPLASWPSLTSASLALVASLAGTLSFFVPGVLQGTAVMNGSARGTALVVFGAAVPVLAVSMLLVSRGAVRPIITWLGAATYLLYNSVMLLIASPFNSLFLFYVAMFALSLWSIVLVLNEIDPHLFARRFDLALPARALAAFLGGVAILNVIAWLAGAVPALFRPMPPSFLEGTGLTTMPTYVQDLSFWLPVALIVAAWLWRGLPWGIVLAGPLFVYGVLEGVGVAIDQAFGHAADPSSNVVFVAGIPGFAVLAVMELLATSVYLRHLNSN
jgi:hypothetical protein